MRSEFEFCLTPLSVVCINWHVVFPPMPTVRSVQPAKSEKTHKFPAGTFDTDSTVDEIVRHWSTARAFHFGFKRIRRPAKW